MVKQVKSVKGKLSGEQPDISWLYYPGGEILPVQPGPKSVTIIELTSVNPWRMVLDYYRKLLSGQGWELFEDHIFDDRGTVSFRHSSQGMVTVLAAQDADATHIRIYTKK
ncbi:MAG: hypothetical protein AB1489_04005 [Acidobacteriota bacterium]